MILPILYCKFANINTKNITANLYHAKVRYFNFYEKPPIYASLSPSNEPAT